MSGALTFYRLAVIQLIPVSSDYQQQLEVSISNILYKIISQTRGYLIHGLFLLSLVFFNFQCLQSPHLVRHSQQGLSMTATVW